MSSPVLSISLPELPVPMESLVQATEEEYQPYTDYFDVSDLTNHQTSLHFTIVIKKNTK